jgi:hypothetical protein
MNFTKLADLRPGDLFSFPQEILSREVYQVHAILSVDILPGLNDQGFLMVKPLGVSTHKGAFNGEALWKSDPLTVH